MGPAFSSMVKSTPMPYKKRETDREGGRVTSRQNEKRREHVFIRGRATAETTHVARNRKKKEMRTEQARGGVGVTLRGGLEWSA